MEYEVKSLEAFSMLGFPLRTDNSLEGIERIDAHWKKFWEENLLDKIPNKANEQAIGLYTHYESDASRPFTLIAGARVTNLKHVPEDMAARNIPSQKYAVFTAKGKMPQALIDTWKAIPEAGLTRTFLADFELYDEWFSDKEQEVKVYVGIE